MEAKPPHEIVRSRSNAPFKGDAKLSTLQHFIRRLHRGAWPALPCPRAGSHAAGPPIKTFAERMPDSVLDGRLLYLQICPR